MSSRPPLIPASSLISMLSIFRQLLVKAGKLECSAIEVEKVSEDAFSRWIEKYSGEYSRKEIADFIEMDAANLSRQINNQTLSFDRCLAVAEFLGADARIPLICCGHLGLEDFSDGLSQMLAKASLGALVDVVMTGQKFLMSEINELGNK
ncbi:hypothetical protein ACN081_07365 [Rothia sp. P13129]|uniref:hypothetical protein n=1 Tax=Rothia sp. P13129 TaxID=3402664 RepID=UPI003AC0732D